MHTLVVGASHVTAPLPLLERLSVPPGELDHLLSRLGEVVDESFVLSTCNRTEIYTAWRDDSADPAPLLLALLADRAGVRSGELRPMTYTRSGRQAISHALRVASGLDSMVLGEDQIQAQFKRALAAARGQETLGPTLDRLGAAALGCGKRVRSFTGIGRHSISLESLAAQVALRHLEGRAPGDMVVVGSGSSAGIVARHLRALGMSVTIVGRTHRAASGLAEEADAACAPWERLPEMLITARAVFCCTSAPHPVLTLEVLARRLRERPGAPLVCVDLGMPRDVDDAVAALDGVQVLSLADLGAVADAHRSARARHLPAAEAIVERETRRVEHWLASRLAAGAISERRARAEALADAELRRALSRLQTTNAHDRAVLAELARRLVRKLMHEETHELKLHFTDARHGDREEAVS